VFRQAPWHHHGLLALEETQIEIRSPYLDNDVVRTVFRAPTGVADSDLCLRLIADARPNLARIRTDRGLTADRSMTSTLGRWMSEASFKAEYASDYGMPHWLARTDALLPALHFDRFWLGRHKFAHFRSWYRNELAPYVQDVLLDPRSRARPYVRTGAVERLVRRHLQGTHNYTTEIHTLLTLELTHRLFVDRSGHDGGYG
jgi:asparagine synthase (glutamine-hydrolysing)